MTNRLEDMLNDCAVIRTTFETLDLFPAADPIREEMMEIVTDARANLSRCCTTLRDGIVDLTVIDRPLDIEEFGKIMRKLLTTGHPRRRLDAFMRVKVFQSVAAKETSEAEPDPLYRHELLSPLIIPAVLAMSAKSLAAAVFDDLRRSIETDANYVSKHAFDRNVFQKYVAILFACYATTDPFFYH